MINEITQKVKGKDYDFWYSQYCTNIEDSTMSLNVEVLYSEQTPFQKLVIMENETFGKFMTLDGLIQLTEKDEFVYHDMIVHPAMAVNPDIKKILIIGGGDGGTAREACRYKSVEKIDMIEIDERVVRACQKYLPITADILDKDTRINLMFRDGLAYIKDAEEGRYDLILVDSTDPDGPGESLFTVDFYKNCYRALTENGILINQHEGAFFDCDIIEMKKAHSKIKQVFPVARVFGYNIPAYPSGYWYFGFASKKFDPVTDHKPELWEKNQLKTKYYNSELHKGAFALPTYVKEILASI